MKKYILSFLVSIFMALTSLSPAHAITDSRSQSEILEQFRTMCFEYSKRVPFYAQMKRDGYSLTDIMIIIDTSFKGDDRTKEDERNIALNIYLRLENPNDANKVMELQKQLFLGCYNEILQRLN